jgi:DNA adenine methylase
LSSSDPAPDVSLAGARPFIKSAGGKRLLLHELRKHVPSSYGTYFEPFVGGGALFFDLRSGCAVLGDANLNLMSAYKGVRDDVDGVVELLRLHEKLHCREHYYAQRRTLLVDGRPVGHIENAAARMIYINKTCFNGLWRVNRKGEFNVPMGDYTAPNICDVFGLKAASMALQGVKLLCQSWEKTAELVQKGDFVYFDPPYWPVGGTSNFTSYTSGGFGPEDQRALRDCARVLRKGGAHVLLSNADVPEVRELYESAFNVRRVQANRAINSKGGKRGSVGELLIW